MTHPAHPAVRSVGLDDCSEGALPAVSPAVSRPLFECLGYEVDHWGVERYVIRGSAGGVLRFRWVDLASIGALLRIHPDLAHWRQAYPKRGDGVDSKGAAAEFVAACHAAGKLADVGRRPA